MASRLEGKFIDAIEHTHYVQKRRGRYLYLDDSSQDTECTCSHPISLFALTASKY